MGDNSADCAHDLAARLESLLRAEGAALVGFADLTVSGVENFGFPRAVSVGLPVPTEIVAEIADGPTPAYAACYRRMNERLDGIVSAGEAFLRAEGHAALAQVKSRIVKDDEFRTPLPHKTVAVRAGLGWIGKSCLLVTPEYGSAVRISTLLTDAPLPCARPIERSRCGHCSHCVDACPANALYDTLWTAGMDRADIFDLDRCRTMLERLCAGLSDDLICGRCFVVCPYTQRYVRSSAASACSK